MTSAMPVIGSSAYLKLARNSELMVQLFSLNDALEFELKDITSLCLLMIRLNSNQENITSVCLLMMRVSSNSKYGEI